MGKMNEEVQGATDNKIIHKKHLKTTGKETTENNLEQSHKQRSYTTAANLGRWGNEKRAILKSGRKGSNMMQAFSRFSLD